VRHYLRPSLPCHLALGMIRAGLCNWKGLLMIYPPLEELLNTAEAAGFTPTQIKLGATQMREFREWAARSVFISNRQSPGAGAPDEYNGIPVVEVTQESRRAYVHQHGKLVILD
jgi:hypothetical protein